MELVIALNAITHCLLHSSFTRDRIKHGRVITSTGISLPALDLITADAIDVIVKANNLSGILRVATMDAVMIFPSLVLYPHEKGACNTQVRAEVKRRLTIWGAGNLDSLAALAIAFRAARPFASRNASVAIIITQSWGPHSQGIVLTGGDAHGLARRGSNMY
jgi:hypothetical protein